MQAAVIELTHGKGADAAMLWILNTLDGPGLIPTEDEPWATDAQRYYDANKSEPFPACHCGTPSHIMWDGRGFCSDAHYKAAKLKRQH